jgi:predicted RNA-binding Zn-ribbon protein involved in translation (DUF1610 family)
MVAARSRACSAAGHLPSEGAVSGALRELGIAVRQHGPSEQRVPCPRCGEAHGARDDALGVNVETGVYHCFRCGWKGVAGNGGGIDMPRPVRIDDPGVAQRKRERLRAIWRETKGIGAREGGPVRNYWRARGLEIMIPHSPDHVLRAHPALEYWDGSRSLGRYPAQVALFQSARGEPVTLHCTYLSADGHAKAAVPTPKKILGVPVKGATRGGAIRLCTPENGRLGLAEGIESALSLAVIRRIPVWASYCAENLAALHLPRDLLEVEIGVDIDASGKGEAVANALACRALKECPWLKVTLVLPEGEGPRDLNDELRTRAG